ncbi:MAG: hypothetical protein HYU77_00515 [Betaproteobacteria bacterium]|nr:hypothetical protein [Betaproteobacteria bacterium]
MRRSIGAGLAAAIASALLVPGIASAADPKKIDWSGVPKSEVVLFYPGQASLQFVTGKEHRKGGAKGVLAGEGSRCLS